MAGSTPKLALRYPDSTDPDDVPTYIHDLATDVEGAFAAKGVLASRPGAAKDGRFYFASDTLQMFRDNGTTWDELVTRPQADAAYVAKASVAAAVTISTQTTASTSYTDLGTVTSVSVTVGSSGRAKVEIGCEIDNDTIGASSVVTVAVSDATTRAASDSPADGGRLQTTAAASGDASTLSKTFVMSGLTPGVNVLTLKFRVTSGTGRFAFRTLTVTPL